MHDPATHLNIKLILVNVLYDYIIDEGQGQEVIIRCRQYWVNVPYHYIIDEGQGQEVIIRCRQYWLMSHIIITL